MEIDDERAGWERAAAAHSEIGAAIPILQGLAFGNREERAVCRDMARVWLARNDACGKPDCPHHGEHL